MFCDTCTRQTNRIYAGRKDVCRSCYLGDLLTGTAIAFAIGLCASFILWIRL